MVIILVYVTDININQFLLTLHCTEEEGKKMFYGVDKNGISLWTYDLTNWNVMDIQNKPLYDIYIYWLLLTRAATTPSRYVRRSAYPTPF